MDSTPSTTAPEPTARDYLRVLRIHRVLIALTVLLAAGLALALSLTQDEVYSATAKMSLSDQSEDLGVLGSPTFAQQTPEQLAATHVDLLGRDTTLVRAKNRLDRPEPLDTLRSKITARVEPQSNLVVVEAQDATPQGAASLANGVADQSVEIATVRARRQYREVAASLRRSLKNLGKKDDQASRSAVADRLALVESLSRVARPVQIVSSARPSDAPVSPKPVRNTIVAGVLGLFLGVLLAFVRNAFDRRIRDPREIQEELGYPLLGQIRDELMGGIAFGEDGTVDFGMESFRILRANLDFLHPSKTVTTVAVISGLPEEGKSTVAGSLAVANALAGRSTLLVECDLRRPSLASRLGIRQGPGLAEYLLGQAEPQDILQTVSTAPPDGTAPADSHQDLVCITAGTPQTRAAELLGSNRFRTFLAQVGELYDTVVIDTSPLLSVVDSREILPLVDAVLLCVRASRTTHGEAAAAKDALSRMPSGPIGLVVTGVRPGRDGGDAYYQYSYGVEKARSR